MRQSHSPSLQDNRAPTIRRKLLRWYDLCRRQLPWRKTRDPYRIWLSEVMLQQTRVQAVIPYYEKFLRRFPDVQALAAADEQSLLACWSGLGYYSRARNLQKAARALAREHQGRFPRDLDAALRLPGVGAYTAPAVLSIAYGVPLAVLDGNVARVMSRLYAVSTDFRTMAGRRNLLRRAEALLSRKRPGDFNQAMMELGATLCLPRQPRCLLCPLREHCRAHLEGRTDQYPAARRKQRSVARKFSAALILDRRGRCLLVRRSPQADWMAGFWELPMWEAENRDSLRSQREGGSTDGILLDRLLGRVRHTITSNRLEVAVFSGRMNRRMARSREKWIALGELARLPITTITRKALRLSPAQE